MVPFSFYANEYDVRRDTLAFNPTVPMMQPLLVPPVSSGVNPARLGMQALTADQFMRAASVPMVPMPYGPPPTVQPQPWQSLYQPQAPTATEQAELQTILATQPNWANALQANLQGSGETLAQRALMTLRLEKALTDPLDKQRLNALLQKGVLTDTAGDDSHSTLYYLSKLLDAPRAEGLSNVQSVRDTIALLDRPFADHQDFAPLRPDIAHRVMDALANPRFDKHQQMAPPQPRSLNDIFVIDSNTCAAACQMSRLASQSPKELTRMLEQLSSPDKTIYEKATPHELSPEAPAMAEELLKSFNLDYHKQPDGSFIVEYPAPHIGYLRAINAQLNPTLNASTGMEALFQTTMVYNSAKKTYDPATDKRDALDLGQVAIQNSMSLTDEQKEALFQLFDNPRADDVRQKVMQSIDQLPSVTPADKTAIMNALFSESVGLTEDERTLMERIMEDGEAMTPVTFQITGARANPSRADEGKNYLYGYTRTFDEMTNDLVTALQNHSEIIIGITFSDRGELPGGHILKIQGYQRNPKTNEIEFLLADSDDDQDTIVVQPASELVPMIHHAGLPHSMAKTIWADIKANPGRFYVPDSTDWQQYQRFDVLNEPVPEGVPMPEPLDDFIVAYQQEQLAKQQNTPVANNIVPFQQTKSTVPG